MKTLLLHADGTVSHESGNKIWRDLPTPREGKARAVIQTTDGETFPFDRGGAAVALVHQHKLGARYALSEIPALLDWLFETSDAYHKNLEKPRARGAARSVELTDWMNATSP